MKNNKKRTLPLLAIAAGLIMQTNSTVAVPKPAGYSFALLATLGDPVPGSPGDKLVNVFEPGAINNHGDVAVGADVNEAGNQAVFVSNKGGVFELARNGWPAPGGGVYDLGFLGPVDLNDKGDMIYNFVLKDFGAPFGVGAGAYRFSPKTLSVNPVVVPFVTAAPTGGKFHGVAFAPTINNRGDEAFTGIVETQFGVHPVPDDGLPYIGLGYGIFRADEKGKISTIIGPGDAVPGTSSTFDFMIDPWINDAGDVSFIAHVAGEESVVPGFSPQADFISALGSLYVKKAATGKIISVVHAGDPAPGGGKFRQAFHDVMNNRGDIAFFGDLTSPPAANENIGAFLYSNGKVINIARPGDFMPGGGKLVNTSIVGGNININNPGDVLFSGVVDSDLDHDGFNDTGLFHWSKGKLSVVARTGTVIPGIGTIDELTSPQQVFPPSPIATTTSGAINNDAGKVMFQATLTDGRGVLLLAAP